jgi:hypothetical protein
MTQLYSNFIYNEERGFVFAYVPKVACTNWKSIQRFMAGKEDWLDQRIAHDPIKSGLRYLSHGKVAQEVLSNPKIKRLAMVRDPYSRALSAYLDKVERYIEFLGKPFAGDYFQFVTADIDRFRKLRLDCKRFPAVNFEVFLLWLRDGGVRFTNDEHWAEQTTLLRHPRVTFDFIGRFENFSSDSEKLLSMMNCSEPLPSQEKINFPPTRAAERLAMYVTPLAQALIEEIYNEDFEAFGYPYWEARPEIEPPMNHERSSSMVSALDTLSRLMIPIRLVVDAGVRHGTRDLIEVFPDKRHILIEPGAEFRSELPKIYSSAGIDSLIVAASASDRDGEIKAPEPVSTIGGDNAANSTVKSGEPSIVDGTTLMRKIDTIIAENGLTGPFLLRIGADDNELRTLQGAADALKAANIVIVDCYMRNISQVSRLVNEVGLELFDIVEFSYRNWQLEQLYVVFVRSSTLPSLSSTFVLKEINTFKRAKAT